MNAIRLTANARSETWIWLQLPVNFDESSAQPKEQENNRRRLRDRTWAVREPNEIPVRFGARRTPDGPSGISPCELVIGSRK